MVYFAVSAVAFLMMYAVRQPLLNIALMIVALLAANCASSILWSCYCISLRDMGLVSGATGFLDFASYMAIGALVTVPYQRKKISA